MDYIGVLAFDLADEGKRIGTGTKKRCCKGMLVFARLRKERKDAEVLLAAGTADRTVFPSQHHTLAEMMAAQMIEVGYRHTTVLTATGMPNAWGSKAEIRKFFEYADKMSPNGYRMHIVSHWWHIPRLWLLVKSLRKTAVFYAVRGEENAIKSELWKLPAQFLITLAGK